MNRKEIPVILLMGSCCGVLLAFSYINPYNDQTTLSELILQLSGSRGDFPLGFSLSELLSFNYKLIPCFLFELYIGIDLYRHFCTASVYVFSRIPNRLAWYKGECLAIVFFVLFYQVIMLVSAIAVTCCRYGVIWNYAGWYLLVIHAVIYSLWLFSMTLLINIIAISFGSGNAFMVVIAVQVVLSTSMTLLNTLENDHSALLSAVINVNPITHLVIGWQYSSIDWLNEAINAPWDVMSLSSSVLYMIVIALLVLFVGGYYVNKCDLIVTDLEFGGM